MVPKSFWSRQSSFCDPYRPRQTDDATRKDLLSLFARKQLRTLSSSSCRLCHCFSRPLRGVDESTFVINLDFEFLNYCSSVVKLNVSTNYHGDYDHVAKYDPSVAIEGAAGANKSFRRRRHRCRRHRVCLLQADRFYLLFVGLSFVLRSTMLLSQHISFCFF